MMTKKDFQSAANIVCATRNEYNLNSLSGELEADDACDLLTDAFVKFFKADNPRFDEARFREACNKKS